MSNGFSYKSNILYLHLEYGIIKKSQVQYLSFFRWIRFEWTETDADGSFYIPTLGYNWHLGSLKNKRQNILLGKFLKNAFFWIWL